MAKYQPRQLEKQVEFEQVMQQMNQDQALENHPFIDRIMEIQKQRELLNIQKKAAKAKGADATAAHWQALARQIEKGLK